MKVSRASKKIERPGTKLRAEPNLPNSSLCEGKDYGDFSEYVQAESEGGNRAAQRVVRIKWLCEALEGRFA